MSSRPWISPDAQLTRRHALWAGALGSVGLSLPRLLAAERATPSRRATSVIWIMPWGGPAQHDTFDLKPDAPEQVRSPFRPIATRTPGFRICEHFPRLAARSHEYAVVRSASHRISTHNPATHYTLTGFEPAIVNRELTTANRNDPPSIGSALAKVYPAEADRPSYVQLPLTLTDNGAFSGGQTAGFLGTAFDPLVVSSDAAGGFEVPGARLRLDLQGRRLDDRRELRDQLDVHADRWSASAAAANMKSQYDRAYSMLRSAASSRAFDVTSESAAVRDRYGRNALGQSVLAARRLVEAGVRLTLVSDTLPNTNGRWDTHDSGSYRTDLIPTALANTDMAVAALLDDLQQRGLLDSTIVLWMAEFGRSPTNRSGGRDHWPQVYSFLIAGGGIQGGRVLGSSDSLGGAPRDFPVKPEDVLATLYELLGVPLDTEIHDSLGRPMRICHGAPIRALS